MSSLFHIVLYMILLSTNNLKSAVLDVFTEVICAQHNVIKFVSDLRQVSGFLRVLRFPPSIKLTATI
jgi:hypothetical protein